MSDAIYSQSLKDTLGLNAQLIAALQLRLDRNQNSFMMSREELTSIQEQLATMGYLATKSMETVEGIITSLQSHAVPTHPERSPGS